MNWKLEQAMARVVREIKKVNPNAPEVKQSEELREWSKKMRSLRGAFHKARG
jgi:hypothetical protein